MTIVVFLGPSLPVDEARKILTARFLPPCKMGDVFSAAEQKPKAIGIIDGYFEQTPAVWHKEILYAMSLGIAVFGGGSMGALRAAELHQFGMKGVGKIFEDFANGVLEDDDEVAVSHLPDGAGFKSQSEAMVNIRHGLDLAAGKGVIGEETRDALLLSAKRMYYPARSWAALYESAANLGVAEKTVAALREFIVRRQPDRKRDDAIAVLKEMAASVSRTEARYERTSSTNGAFSFEPTLFWEHLRTYFGSYPADRGASVQSERVINHVRLADPERNRLRERALLLFLVEQEAKRIGLKPSDARSSMERFRRERNLNTAESLAQWLEAVRAGKEECIELAAVENIVLRLEQRYAEQIDRYLSMVLKLEGRFGAVVKKVQQKWESLDALGVSDPSEEDVDSVDAVMDWYQGRHGKVHTDFQQHVAELGFGSPRQFFSELVGEYLYAQSS